METSILCVLTFIGRDASQRSLARMEQDKRNVLWKGDPVQSSRVLSEKTHGSSLVMENRLCHVPAESSLAWFSQVTWCPL